LARGAAFLVVASVAAWFSVILLTRADLQYTFGGLIMVAGFAAAAMLHIRAAASRLQAERAVLIELQKVSPRGRHDALTDEVTGLYRRWIFIQRLQQELERAQRHGHTLTLVVFSAPVVNALSERGRDVLRRTSEAIKINMRSSDIASSCGAGEFAVCLPETDREGGDNFVRKILKAAPRSAGLLGAVAMMPEGESSAEKVLQRTEQQARAAAMEPSEEQAAS
jgi:GGDEF domain-containing protein